jgi:hypothetical protein
MSAVADLSRFLMIAIIAILLTLPGFDQSASASHDVQQDHHVGSTTTPGPDSQDGSADSCHGVLLCHAAVMHPLKLDLPASAMWHLRERSRSNHLPHLVQLAFDPPPPRGAV